MNPRRLGLMGLAGVTLGGSVVVSRVGLGVLLLDEVISATLVFGAILILLGIFLAERGSGRVPASA